ncbi:MAG: hypothetical protein H6617_08930 [Bdellovibrionaceae bacterium]|nr:hypothetical protein [Bdellovibrionales bacterium]MCB9254791.1 hypothetical protein [Pseudobdellovibrionaceae bacterium]
MDVYNMKIRALVCFLFVLGGCADPKSTFAPSESISCRAPETPRSAWERQSRASGLAVSTVDKNFKEGLIRYVDLVKGQVWQTPGLGSGDSFVRADEKHFYVVNRLRQDGVRILDRLTMEALVDKHDEDLSNPSDVAVVGDKLFLSRYEKKTLRRYRLPELVLEKEYDLSPFADGDGIPEAQWMKHSDGRLYIELQRLTRDPKTPLMLPKDSGAVAVLDIESDTLQPKAIALTGGNPVTDLKFDPKGDLFVGTMGQYAKLDGGIERVTGKPGFVVTEEELGGDIVDFAWTGETELVAIVRSLPPVHTRLLRVQLGESRSQTIITERPRDFYEGLHSVLYLENCNSVVVADRDTENPRLFFVSLEDFAYVPGRYLSVGLAPYHMVVAP